MTSTGKERRFGTLLVVLFACLRGTCCFHVTFEENEADSESMKTARAPHAFYLTSGERKAKQELFPQTDITRGDKHGQYIVATYGGGLGQETTGPQKILFSRCMEPVGRNCTFNFNAWMSESRRRNESLEVIVMFFCSFCSHNLSHSDVLMTINNSNHSSEWRHYSVSLRNTFSIFVISLLADVPDSDSVVALDELSLENCQIYPEEVCGEGEFQCPHSTRCIETRQLCDLTPDCPCAEDEFVDVCEQIPEEGKVSFQDCHFEKGLCFWYNVSHQRDGWHVMTDKNFDEELHSHLPHIKFAPGYAYIQPKSNDAVDVLRSVPFPPCSSSDGQCKVRFQYSRSWNVTVRVELIELQEGLSKTLQLLWESPGLKTYGGPQWHRAEVTINDRPRRSYVLQLSTKSQVSYNQQYRYVAVTNITLTPDCFTQDTSEDADKRPVNLTTCGAIGHEGPTQSMCDDAYGDRQSVTVLEDKLLAGAQLWSVKVSTIYTLQAYGARGGNGEERIDAKSAYGTLVRSKFRLYQGEKLLVVVGQMGYSSCQGDTPGSVAKYCREVSAIRSGGGGGGGTFVYRMRSGKDEYELLLLAGGGGGLPYASFTQLSLWHGETVHDDQGGTRKSYSGLSLEEDETDPWWSLNDTSGFVGQACQLPNSPPLALGGFGRGFGACNESGGHGGGYRGSHAVTTADPSPGLPGVDYVHSDNLYNTVEHGRHPGQGRLEIHLVDWTCPCHFKCLVQRPDLLGQPGVKAIEDGVLICICRSGQMLDHDRLSCVTALGKEEAVPLVQEPNRSQEMPIGVAILVSIILIIVVLIIVLASFVIYAVRINPGDERMWAVRMLVSRCLRVRLHQVPLHTFPPTAMPARVMQINPNYSFTSGKMPEQKLPEIPRDNLRMSVQLGQGAFGEVYKGFLSGVSGTEREVAVAVKTLPRMCSEQTELDFFMEAFIISKFHHPNIVQFLGVCFEQHPRYLVLELLEGGNLKSFLREQRPSEGKTSLLTVGDLLNLAKDVACGCHYLENNHFIHRDIAARNCLLTTKGPERMAKIADFGMSRDVYRADYYKKEGRALLPLKWMPPEAFMEGIFTVKTDVWSYGVVLWEIYSMGYMPYPGLNNTEVMNFVYIGGRLDPPEGCPPKMHELMQSCWKHKAEERPSFEIILQILNSISQDTATMNQHLPSFQWPAPSEGRGLKLLNPPVPVIASEHSSPGSLADTSDMEPLLKSVDVNSVRSRSDTDYKLSVAMQSPCGAPKKHASELNYFEPLLPISEPSEEEDFVCQNGHTEKLQGWTNYVDSSGDKVTYKDKGGANHRTAHSGRNRSRTNLPLACQEPMLPQIEEIEMEDDIGHHLAT